MIESECLVILRNKKGEIKHEGGLSDTAAKIYADGLIKFYNYSESYVRKRAENYDYAYNKAINNQKSRYQHGIIAVYD